MGGGKAIKKQVPHKSIDDEKISISVHMLIHHEVFFYFNCWEFIVEKSFYHLEKQFCTGFSNNWDRRTHFITH